MSERWRDTYDQWKLDSPYDDEEDFDDECEPEEEDEMVFDCGVDGCLMPGEHLRSECHTVADIRRQGQRCPDGDWIGDELPGGMECEDCGCIFISNDGRALCRVCYDARFAKSALEKPR